MTSRPQAATPPAANAAGLPEVVPTLKDAIWERYIKTLDIKRRVYFLRAFLTELDRVTRKKPFQIRNDIVWNMILDARDKCIIDLYSLSVELRHGVRPKDPAVRVGNAFMRKRGVFHLVREHYCASLSRTYVPDPGDDSYEIALHTKGKAERFARLFPGCTAETPSPADIEDLCERFRLRMVPLGMDRNKNRAHSHEGDIGTAKMHSVPELEELFNYCEELLEDLSLVSEGAAFGGGNMNHANCDATAADLVDQVLFGHARDIARLCKGRTRDELLARLHEIDDTRKSERGDDVGGQPRWFNTCQFDPMFEGFLDALAGNG